MIDLIGLNTVDEVGDLIAGREVAIVKKHLCARQVGILVNMVDSRGVKRAGASNDAVDFIALGQQQLG